MLVHANHYLDVIRDERVYDFLLGSKEDFSNFSLDLLHDQRRLIGYNLSIVPRGPIQNVKSSAPERGLVALSHMVDGVALVYQMRNTGYEMQMSRMVMSYDPFRKHFVTLSAQPNPDGSYMLKGMTYPKSGRFALSLGFQGSAKLLSSNLEDLNTFGTFRTLRDCDWCLAAGVECSCPYEGQLLSSTDGNISTSAVNTWSFIKYLSAIIPGPGRLLVDGAGLGSVVRMIHTTEFTLNPDHVQMMLQATIPPLFTESSEDGAGAGDVNRGDRGGQLAIGNTTPWIEAYESEPAVGVKRSGSHSSLPYITPSHGSKRQRPAGDVDKAVKHQSAGSDIPEVPSPGSQGQQPAGDYDEAAKNQTAGRYSCEVCLKLFRFRSRLKRHVESVHAQAKKYQCDQCTRRFTQKEHLDTHWSHVHGPPKRYECNGCGSEFAWRTNLHRHQRSQQCGKQCEVQKPFAPSQAPK